MATSFEQQPTGTSAETVFPLDPKLIDSYLRVFGVSDEQMYDLVQAARGEAGAESSVYHHIPLAELTEWHKTETDFSGGDMYYKMGVLYGHDVTQHAVRVRDSGQQLLFDNDEAFAQALAYMKETYRGLDDQESGWRRQKLRELRYTGSDTLSIAAATQHDLLLERLPLRLDNPDVDDTLAFHVGLVDGAILTDAYHAFKHGRQPKKYNADEQQAYAPLLGPQHTNFRFTDGAVDYQFEKGDLLKGAEALRIINAARRLGMSALPVARTALIYHENVFVHVAPNSFRTMTEAQAVLHVRYGLGAASVRGLVLGGSYGIGDVLLASFGK